MADFEKWLRAEAKKHPEMKQRGKPGQVQIEPLKWLAAYRLRSAGFTFEQAQKKIVAYHDGERVDLPLYADKSRWSNAISRARARLAELEAKLLSNEP